MELEKDFSDILVMSNVENLKIRSKLRWQREVKMNLKNLFFKRKIVQRCRSTKNSITAIIRALDLE